MTTAEAAQQARETAAALYSAKPDWVTFYREVLGVHGLVRRLYPTAEELAEFEKTDAYHEIQQMLAELRRTKGTQPDEDAEPTRVITVRMPKSLHEMLHEEAYTHRTSVNKLCISKLLRIIDSQCVPGRPTPGKRPAVTQEQ